MKLVLTCVSGIEKAVVERTYNITNLYQKVLTLLSSGPTVRWSDTTNTVFTYTRIYIYILPVVNAVQEIL